MYETFQTVFLLLFLAAWLAFSILCGIRLWKRHRGPIRISKATVIHKQTTETFSKYHGTGKHTEYVVVFRIEDKKRSFNVSRFSYESYRIGQTGTLEYRGDRLIDFH